MVFSEGMCCSDGVYLLIVNSVKPITNVGLGDQNQGISVEMGNELWGAESKAVWVWLPGRELLSQ